MSLSVNVPQKYKKIQKLQNFRPAKCKICVFPANFVPLQRENGIVMKNLFAFVMFAALTATAVMIASCNVTRTVTTESQFFQKGDTTCTIVTKTIETYDATKK